MAAIKAIRIKSAKCNTKKSSEEKTEIKKENCFSKFRFRHNTFYKTAPNIFKMYMLHFTLPHIKDSLKAAYTYNDLIPGHLMLADLGSFPFECGKKST